MIRIHACKVSTIALSDHYPVCFVRHLRANYDRKHGHTTITYRSYKNFDEKSFLADLAVVPWSVIEQFDDVDDEITDAMDKRDSLKQSRYFPNYKLWRNM